jgi:hypothetical protein
VTSPDFVAGGALPRSATVHGAGVPPVLVVRRVPEEAKALVVVCEGPDAPLPEPFVHWLLFRLEGRDMTIDADVVAGAAQGKNSTLHTGYAPVHPPAGHGVHHYHFQVFALDDRLHGAPEESSASLPAYQEPLGVQVGTGRSELIEQMRGHVIAWGEIVGTCEER